MLDVPEDFELLWVTESFTQFHTLVSLASVTECKVFFIHPVYKSMMKNIEKYSAKPEHVILKVRSK